MNEQQEREWNGLYDEYARNGERLNDIEAHYQEARWEMPEWKQVVRRQRELEKRLFPTGDAE